MYYENWMNSGEWSSRSMYSDSDGKDNYYGASNFDQDRVVGIIQVEIAGDSNILTETQKFAIGLAVIMRYEDDAEIQGDIEEIWVGSYGWSHRKMSHRERALMKHCGWEKDDYYDCWNFKLKGGDDE